MHQTQAMGGSVTTLDMTALNKESLISAAHSAGKSATFIGVDLLFSSPVLASFGLSAVQDLLWDAITPPHEDYCGRITLNPWIQIGKDFPSLSPNFNY